LPNWRHPVLAAEDWTNAGFGVYIHWPFCQSKCPYCDFNSHVRAAVDHAQWRIALLLEIEAVAARIPGRRVDTIFFGGGTPSLMQPDTVQAVIEKVASVWQLSPVAEITLEANPSSVEADRFSALSQAGINRVSLGIQSLRQDHLKRLGRLHTVKEARQAFDIARKNFTNVSFDLIYARQYQDLGDWEEELGDALAMAADHLSLYQLTIESKTRFGDLHARGKLKGLPDPDFAADMYDLTQDICEAAGMAAYEVSNHARLNSECKHNMIYWRYGDYAGIGPGAHGRLTIAGQRIATHAKSNPEAWLKDVKLKGSASTDTETISPADQAAEYLMMSLRLTEGTDIQRYHSIAGFPLSNKIILELQEQNLVGLQANRLATTAKGRLVLNSVLSELLTTPQA
jgi:putative oxygen-independent coproporphyrinogen III oxidase